MFCSVLGSEQHVTSRQDGFSWDETELRIKVRAGCCADDDDFGSEALPARVPFRGFSTAAAPAAEVGTPSPFGSAMAQHMASR